MLSLGSAVKSRAEVDRPETAPEFTSTLLRHNKHPIFDSHLSSGDSFRLQHAIGLVSLLKILPSSPEQLFFSLPALLYPTCVIGSAGALP